MKKIILFCFSIWGIFLYSCDGDILEVPAPQAEINQIPQPTNTRVDTNFNPISELRNKNIPLNIINVGNTKNKFLSAAPDGNKISIYNRDDGSLRQRWYLADEGLVLVGGNKKFSKPGQKPVICSDRPGKEESSPVLITSFGGGLGPVYMTPIDNTPYYAIINIDDGGGGSIIYSRSIEIGNACLYSTTQTGTGLKFKKVGTSSDLAKWEIRPVGEYKVTDIVYVMQEEDIFSRNDQRLDRAIIENIKNELC